MKTIGLINTTAFFLLLGIAGPAKAAQDKPQQQEEKPAPARPEQQAKPEHQQQAKPEQQAKPKQETKPPQPAKPEDHAKPQQQTQAQQPKPQAQEHAKTQQDQQQKQQGQKEAAASKPPQQAKTQEAPLQKQQTGASHPPQRTQQAQAAQHAQPALHLSARGSGRIPDDRFHSNFGREHAFHVGNPVMVGGYSRFQYGGYWFGFVQPWPVGWYYTDDVYIDYVDGGYYMYNPYYPGARFSISVVI